MGDSKKVAVIGGAGYIGSHTCKELAKRGFSHIVIDNLSTGYRHNVRWGRLYQVDIKDTNRLIEILQSENIDAVVHFAAKAYVGESVQNPMKYYNENVGGMLSLIKACIESGIEKFVFSSSCATYGEPNMLPISETQVQKPINPYGRTKLICEQILQDVEKIHRIRSVALRYFNAAGADPDRELCEQHEPETHLIPLAIRALDNPEEELKIYGNDFPTPDGTAIRDYVHVTDLARAHCDALNYLGGIGESVACNLASGTGHSVLEIVDEIELQTGLTVCWQMAPRRSGDPAALWADNTKARELLHWEATNSSLQQIIKDALNSLRR